MCAKKDVKKLSRLFNLKTSFHPFLYLTFIIMSKEKEFFSLIFYHSTLKLWEHYAYFKRSKNTHSYFHLLKMKVVKKLFFVWVCVYHWRRQVLIVYQFTTSYILRHLIDLEQTIYLVNSKNTMLSFKVILKNSKFYLLMLPY